MRDCSLYKELILLSIVVCCSSCLATQQTDPKITLFELKENNIKYIEASEKSSFDFSKNDSIILNASKDEDWPGLTFSAPNGHWNLSSYKYVAIDVTNKGNKHCAFTLKLVSGGENGKKVYRRSDLLPGQTRTLRVYLHEIPCRFDGDENTIAMRCDFNSANITGFIVYLKHPDFDHKLEIKNIRAEGYSEETTAEKFFPFIDKFGQYRHRNWPGKIKSEESLKASVDKELKDLQTNPTPDNWDKYGGWAAGPKLEATGSFRTEKYQGKWWLVDPLGHLFWSTGIDCIGSWGSTPITDREDYFDWLPNEDSNFMQFYGTGGPVNHGYYKKMEKHKTFNFTRANLYRKYSKDWQKKEAELLHKRLRSWGINTIGNWSDHNICKMKKTPYVTSLSSGSKHIHGVSFPDPFDQGFRNGITNRLKSMADTINDPWCIGYFVDNELGWGNNTKLSLATLTSPADQPAKKNFVDHLMKKYVSIEKLNDIWHTEHQSWQSLLNSTDPPQKKYAKEDLIKFYTILVDKYFETISNTIHQVAPNKLYLGCRFAGDNEEAALAAAKHCDVISYNIYYYDVSCWQKKGIDRPVLIGEFHFGARDRGLFDEGLRFAHDQQDRARCYEHYIKSALTNPLFVGAHWFEYRDHPATGRFDGENYQIGFIDICDQPYKEMIEASRALADQVYEYRLKTNR